MQTPDQDARGPLVRFLALFVASGAAALIYQVLWLKELGRLFGVTAYAASVTLAVFFLGLAFGGWALGRVADRLRNPLRTYAWLELGVGSSALFYFLLFDVYRAVQGPLFGAIGYRPAILILVKFALAAGILFLPAFLMGGTLPVMAQVLVRRRSQLGARVTLLYAANTTGAAAGALAAGFVLPRILGFNASYLVAIGLNVAVALLAWFWSGRETAPVEVLPVPETPADSREGLPARVVLAVAAVSGFATLGLEVIWTRMFSQVLQNSVYTFSIILTVFLAGLALGSAVAHLLCRRVRSERLTLALLLTGSGILVACTPLLFRLMSASIDYTGSDLGFWTYVAIVFAGAVVSIGPAVVVMGAVFPFLMKLSERHSRGAGRTVGQLTAVNTAAAILGSLAAGFLLLEVFGVWGNIRALAAVYLLLALAVWPWKARERRVLLALPLLGLVVAAVVLDYGDYRDIWLKDGEQLVESWDGPAGAVAVVRHGENALRIRVNSSYNLGSSASAVNERLQGQIPLLLHPRPRSVFFLGLGTGITASGALDFDLERIVACEVNADVIRASRKHFGPWLNGLFEDPRVSVYPEDGRTWLAATRERFDVVVADIFLSFKAGVGSLYTLEHFSAVRERLEPGGVFVQWLPMFDFSEPEFEIVARTMLEVFPSVTLWRRSHSPKYPVYALVGRLEQEPIDPFVMEARLEMLRARSGLDPETWLLNIPYAAYAGNIRAMEERFQDAPLNTDDRTVLEYVAPMTERNRGKGDGTEALAFLPLLEFATELLAAVPPERDPQLSRLPPPAVSQVRAGLAYYGYTTNKRLGREREAQAYLEQYQREIAPTIP